jgi:hypothetical protein
VMHCWWQSQLWALKLPRMMMPPHWSSKFESTYMMRRGQTWWAQEQASDSSTTLVYFVVVRNYQKLLELRGQSILGIGSVLGMSTYNMHSLFNHIRNKIKWSVYHCSCPQFLNPCNVIYFLGPNNIKRFALHPSFLSCDLRACLLWCVRVLLVLECDGVCLSSSNPKRHNRLPWLCYEMEGKMVILTRKDIEKEDNRKKNGGGKVLL